MRKIDLSGSWALHIEDKPLDISGINDWSDSINLPGTLSEQKKTTEQNKRHEGYLTDPYAFEGYAWFKKQIQITDYDSNCNYTLLLERTRISTLWINGTLIGTNNSLCGKHLYDITEAVAKNQTLDITICIANVGYPTKGGHMTSPDTQTNWLGITGELSIIEEDKIHLEKLRFYTSDKKELRLTADLLNTDSADATLTLKEVIFDWEKDKSYSTTNAALLQTSVALSKGSNDLTINLPDNTILWSAEEPNLYQAELKLGGNVYNQHIGFKTFAVNKTFLEINGRREFLRGKHDGMIFPDTGYAPCTLEGWLKVMKKAKEYGINHYRFHTCCPPEAAFIAADLLGIYMEPELPFWGTIQNVGEEGFNQVEQDYLIEEGFKILDNFGNHTSFVMMSMGNELWGSNERLNFILKNYHDYDARHLYTSGSNNFQFWPQTMEYEDFFAGVRFDTNKNALIRGSYAMCDAPLGFIQTDEPNTNHDYDLCFATPTESVTQSSSNENAEIEIQYGTGVKKVKASSINTNAHFLPHKPVISHEVGQYCMYPDYKELKRYTGVLKPYNYEIFRERLEKAGMLNQAEDFFRDSSRLASQCYKQEIEALIRSNEMSGFQLLDIQDFTGQGTAVVGILNSFMESKGIVTGEQWRSFCNETVLLASFPKFVLADGETFQADILLSNYSNKTYKGDVIWAYLIDAETDEIIEEESYENNNPVVGNKLLGTFKFKFGNITEYKKYTLMLYLNGEKELFNSYVLHVYPKADDEIVGVLQELKEKGSANFGGVYLTTDSKDAKEAAKAKKKVILIPEAIDENLPGAKITDSKVETVPGTYCTDFWCYPMFRSISESMNKPVPIGTLGLTIHNDDTIFGDFKTDTYTTPKWYNIISNATCVNLDSSIDYTAVQMIDNFERNWKLGLVWETDGILVCTSKLYELTDKPEAVLFTKSLINSLK